MIGALLWCFFVATVTKASLIPYGESEGDKYIAHSNDNTATVLSVPFVYFEKSFAEIYISPNGAVSFNENLPAEIVPLKDRNVIAIYYAKTTGGNIYQRVTKDQRVIRDLTAKLSTFSEAKQFLATEAVLITYEDMTGKDVEGHNLFQLGLLTNGTESYAILIYSHLDYSSSADRYAELGFYSASGRVEPLYNTGTSNAKEVAKLSMLSEKGVYAYKTTSYPEYGKDIFSASNDDYEYSNTEPEYDSQEEPADCPKDEFKENCPVDCSLVPDSRGCKMCVCGRKRNSDAEELPTRKEEADSRDSHEPDTLPQQIVPIQSRKLGQQQLNTECSPSGETSEACHINAYCAPVDGGHCCKCSSNFLGNGKDCVNKSISIRATGTFEGVISGHSIPSVDLYAYVDTVAGQQHTQISGFQQEIASSLKLLDSIGNGFSWLFAKVESADVENGFQLTGGVFNRTLNIHLGERHSIVIKQEFLGRENDALRVKIFLRGTLPTLEADATVSFTDFEEKYTREEAGLLRSYADRHVMIKQGEQEVQHRLTVDQQIRYNECPFKQNRNSVSVVRVSRVTSGYGQNDKTLRFSSQSSIYNEESARRISEQNNNPCINSYHVCNQPNMFCKPENGQYRCECEAGYRYLQDDTVEPKFRCVDADECSRNNPCDRNAECFNTAGSYTCRCRPGYVGDGKRCTRDEAETAGVTSGCRSHSECHQWGECVFSANTSSGFCKCRGWYVGDGVSHCGPPEIHYNVEPNQYNEGQRHHHPVSIESCENRLNCHVHAQCVASGRSNPPALCQCRQGFEGNGTHCTAKDEVARLPADNNKICADQSECHQFAHCILVESKNTYYCSCLHGYKGDGHTKCVKSEECDYNNPSGCDSNAQCRFSYEAQVYRCECVQGYVRQGDACVVGNQPPPQETCDMNPYICHPEASCVHNEAQNRHTCVCKAGKQGDGYVNCGDSYVSNTDVCRSCGSNAECVRNSRGLYSCVCKAGFVGDGRNCQAVTSCSDDHSLCSPNAHCLPDHRGVYICTCNFGYTGNGYVCNPAKQDQTHPLLIARGMAIIHRSTDANVPGRQFIVVQNQVVVDIDYDCISERIYWSDIAGFSIRSATSNGTDTQIVYKNDLRSPEGIAIDYASRNLYYVDSIKDEIGVISIDGRYQKGLITEGLVNPRALAIDLDGRKLYYSDWHRRNPRIGRVDLDGSSNQDFVKDDIGLPNGLTFLPNRRELCWVDAGKKQLNCIRTDGTGRRIVYSPLEYPFGLTHENEERFYWTDWKDHKVHSVSIYGDSYRSFTPSVVGQGKIYGILSMDTKCKGKQTECSNNNGGCQYLCLPGQQGATCVCPDNVNDVDC